MKLKVITVLIVMLFSGLTFAQSNVEIKDIAVSNIVEIDTITSLPVESNYELLSVSFKINQLQSGYSVHLLVGTAEDTGGVLTWQNNITETEGEYYLNSGGENRLIVNKSVNVVVQLSESEFENYSHITLYLEDGEGEQTQRLYFTK